MVEFINLEINKRDILYDSKVKMTRNNQNLEKNGRQVSNRHKPQIRWKKMHSHILRFSNKPGIEKKGCHL